MAKLGEPIFLTCLAQASPRPQIRWFRQRQTVSSALTIPQQANIDLTPNEWIEITSQADQSSRFSVSTNGNFLLIKTAQLSDQRTRFRCLANNTFGQHSATTEIRLDLWPLNKLVEVEPKIEYVNAVSGSRPTALSLNCTVRALASQSLLALEWIRNGRQIFTISGALPSDPSDASTDIGGQLESNSSLFDWSSEQLSAIDLTKSESEIESGLNAELEPSVAIQSQARLMQTLRVASNRETLLYQLHIDPVRRSDRGTYQCRARYSRTVQQSSTQLMLKDQAPQFVESFPSQLIARSSSSSNLFQRSDPSSASSSTTIIHQTSSVSLKCVASGSPLPEISWSLSGFPIPESPRLRVGDYVTRDGLIVSFVNITHIQVEGK